MCVEQCMLFHSMWPWVLTFDSQLFWLLLPLSCKEHSLVLMLDVFMIIQKVCQSICVYSHWFDLPENVLG